MRTKIPTEPQTKKSSRSRKHLRDVRPSTQSDILDIMTPEGVQSYTLEELEQLGQTSLNDDTP